LREKNVRLVFADVADHVRRELGRSGVREMVGADAFFDDASEVLEKFQTSAVHEHDDGSTPSR